MNSKSYSKTKNYVLLAALTAIVLILQLAGVTVRLGATNVSLVLIPIVFGAITLGPLAGAWLGFVFGVETLIVGGVMGMDPLFTAILFQSTPVMTALICIVKSTVAGYVAGLLYQLIEKKSKIAALFVAAAAAPIVNTGLFILGGLLISDVLAEKFANGAGVSVIYFLVFGCAGINFIFEFVLNMVVTPLLRGVIEVATRSFGKK